MKELINRSFSEFDKFPICFKETCLTLLEIQNRFTCFKCLKVFCSEHRIDFNHDCPSKINNDNNNNFITQKQFTVCSLTKCNCKLTEINKFKCNICNKEYCISHRPDFVHQCKK